jgi:hypothetical protein
MASSSSSLDIGDEEGHQIANNNQKPEEVRPIIIYDVQDGLKKSNTEQSRLFQEWHVYEHIERVTLDRNKNLAIFAKSINEANELIKNPNFFKGLKKVNLNATESLPAAIFKEEVDIQELNKNGDYLRLMGVEDIIVLEPKSRKLYSDASQPKSDTVKVFFKSIKERDEAVKNGLKILFRVYKLEPSIRIIQCLNCKQFGHTVSKCIKYKKCARCNFEGETHDEKQCRQPFCCANCNESHSAFDRSCLAYRKFKREQLFNIQSEKQRDNRATSSNNKFATRNWSNVTKASGNGNAEILALLNQQEASRKNDNNLFENKILSYLGNAIDKCHESLQQHIATSNINAGLALNEILTKILPEKASIITQAVNEAYPKYNLGQLNAQSIIPLTPTQQISTSINHINNFPQNRLATLPTINLPPSQFTQVFSSLQQQQPQHQQLQQPQLQQQHQSQQQQQFFFNPTN